MTPKYNGRAREFSIEEIKAIGQAVIKGTKITTLEKEYKASARNIKRAINYYNDHVVPRSMWRTKGFVQKTLGSKVVPYYETEAEMLKTPKYTWNSLSKIEKRFYLNYGKKEEGHSPND